MTDDGQQLEPARRSLCHADCDGGGCDPGGAALYGAYDPANAVHPDSAALTGAFPADPRGFLTFAVAGLAVAVFSWLMLRGAVFTALVAYLGLLTGVLLIALYLAYMVTVNATNPAVVALILATGVLNPLWYL